MTLFLSSLGVEIIIMIGVIFGARKNKSEMALLLKQIIGIGIVITVLVVIQTLIKGELESRFLYGMYFCATDWLMFSLAKFTLKFTDSDKYTKYINMLFPVLIFDIFFMLINSYKAFAFDVVIIDSIIGSIYKFVPLDYFIIHGAIVYSLVIFSFLILLVKAIRCPIVYKKKYFIILGIIVGIVALNTAVMYMGDTVDISVYGYGIGAILFHYFTLKHIPNELMNQTLAIIARESKEGIIIFDETVCLYANSKAQEYLRDEKLRKIDTITGMNKVDLLKQYFDEDFIEPDEDITLEKRIVDGNETFYYQSYYKKVRDKKGRVIGTSLIIYDKSEEQRELMIQKYSANHDMLTDLYTREYFIEMVGERFKSDPEGGYYLICSDITRFKLINDLFGQRTANNILIKMAEELRIRLPESAIYARMYGDRFAILLDKNYYDEKIFYKIAEEMNFINAEYQYTVKVCFGVYSVVDKSLPISVMCDRAISCISGIKEDYRKCVEYYSEEARLSLKREQELIAEMDQALEQRDITIFLQPIVSADGKVVGAEALARWIHPEKGIISPSIFVPVFERRNLIVKMDIHIWELACQRLAIWQKEGKDWFISVNLSSKDIYFLDVFEVFTRLVAQHKIPADKLRLEITESAIANDINTLKNLVDRLRRFGFVVEIDDFGSGYSSLNMLSSLSVDVVKIDRVFLDSTTTDRKSREILKSVIQLVKNIGMSVITEGIEHEEQIKLLDDVGCDMYQGYYYSKPVKESEFIQIVDGIENRVC